MSRRTRKWAWLEGTKVYFKKGRYVVVLSRDPYKEEPIAPGGATRLEVYTALERYEQRGKNTLNSLIDDYLQSEDFHKLAPASQKSYHRLLSSLAEWEMPRIKKPFGTLLLQQIGNKTIQSAFDQQFDAELKNTARNRRFAVLKVVFNWGIQRFPGCEKNPVIGLRIPAEAPRDRYVSDKDYAFILDIAPTRLQLIMRAIYLLRLRPSEARTIHRKLSEADNKAKKSGVVDDGILVFRGKGSWGGLVEWSDDLLKWNTDCKTHNRDFITKWQIRDNKGNRITKGALDSMWRRVWAKAQLMLEDGQVESIPDHYTLHDLKAKGLTDHPNKDAGHKSPKMREVYDREHRRELPTR